MIVSGIRTKISVLQQHRIILFPALRQSRAQSRLKFITRRLKQFSRRFMILWHRWNRSKYIWLRSINNIASVYILKIVMLRNILLIVAYFIRSHSSIAARCKTFSFQSLDLFFAWLLFMKGTSWCVVTRNQSRQIVRELWQSFKRSQVRMISVVYICTWLRRFWQHYNLPCVSALFWPISIVR